MKRKPVAKIAGQRRKEKKSRSEARDAALARTLEDTLGERIRQHTKILLEEGWESLVHRLQEEDLRVVGDGEVHPAGTILKSYQRNGVPVVLKSSPWSRNKIKKLLARGSHKSCNEHLDFMRTEFLEFVEKGFWVILPYRHVRKFKHLRLSPMGVVPQRERRPRLIVDYTFHGVNPETVPLAPKEAMQFGRALERILYKVRHANPKYGPVYLSKTDLADGFYRIPLSVSGCPKLGVIFPRYPGEEQMVAIPLVLPMGWVESPPAFCAATETVADIANNRSISQPLPEHPLERLSQTEPTVEETIADPDETPITSPTTSDAGVVPVLQPFRHPVAHHDIYVDDFISLIQGPLWRRRHHIRGLLHSIDEVFRPLEPGDSPHRQHVPSTKKFKKGDGCLLEQKIILGWLLNTAKGTLELPPHRVERLNAIFEDLRNKDRVSVKQWHKVLGELRSMSLGVPGSKGLFSTLQAALQYTEKNRIRINQPMRDQLQDFELLAKDLSRRPTRLSELVPDYPVAIGPHDASGEGMGGAWLPTTKPSNLQPTLWRARFPMEIVDDLVTFDNPEGSINNSQLELAGNIAHQDVLVNTVDCADRTIAPLGDNIAQVAWQLKGSNTGTGATSYLLRLNSLHQRQYRYLASPSYIPGPLNVMADDLSRLWYLSDSQMLDHFNSNYPQELPWNIATLRPAMLSALISALRKKPVDIASLQSAQPRKILIGEFGKNSAKILESSPSCKESPTSFLFSRYSPYDSEQAPSHPAVTASQLGAWKTTLSQSERRSPHWGPVTHA